MIESNNSNMSNYKRNIEANRNALFASASSPGGTRKPASKAKASSTALSTGTSTSTSASGIRNNPTTSRISKISRTMILSGSAKAEKMKEAETAAQNLRHERELLRQASF